MDPDIGNYLTTFSITKLFTPLLHISSSRGSVLFTLYLGNLDHLSVLVLHGLFALNRTSNYLMNS